MSLRTNNDSSDSCGEDEAEQRMSRGISVDEESEPVGHSKINGGGSTTFVQKRGFLYKLGGNVKNWKLRYVVLNPGYFCYYKDASVLKPIGEVKLKNVTVMESDHTSKGKQPFQFVVHTESTWNNRCDWILAAVKAEELQDWITAFQLAGQRR
eukprot:Em0015g729a